jgi:hypothetical protein
MKEFYCAWFSGKQMDGFNDDRTAAVVNDFLDELIPNEVGDVECQQLAGLYSDHSLQMTSSISRGSGSWASVCLNSKTQMEHKMKP